MRRSLLSCYKSRKKPIMQFVSLMRRIIILWDIFFQNLPAHPFAQIHVANEAIYLKGDNVGHSPIPTSRANKAEVEECRGKIVSK